jgi:hypothetical protein
MYITVPSPITDDVIHTFWTRKQTWLYEGIIVTYRHVGARGARCGKPCRMYFPECIDAREVAWLFARTHPGFKIDRMIRAVW